MIQRVFVDANVLFSRTLRDWLFLLRAESKGGLFQIHTTWDIITEAGSRLRDKYPEASGTLVAELVDKCQLLFDEILVNYPGGKVPEMTDREDWHVHHAATASRANVLLTEDTGFLSEDTFYEVFNCDEFFVEINSSAPSYVRNVTEKQAVYWAARNGKSLPDALRDSNCPMFADAVQQHILNIGRCGSSRRT
ncbi:PIN domain-containing protein [Glutamicibacter endophyticus]|uniref:PIN domain-containing protein n=1 Tax=Glutamicibacter endophyticus TaxID=1522174 RepID=UPI003AF16638